MKLDPIKVRNVLRSFARNTSNMVGITTLEKDICQRDFNNLSRPTIYDYLNVLDRLMITENQLAWATHIRSSSSLRKVPRRHFLDVALAVASLGLKKKHYLKIFDFLVFYLNPW